MFDDGCVIPEKTLVTIGNNAVLNAGSIIQCHSLEDGYFQFDYSSIGASASLGTKAFVHYGVTIGDGAILEADSFVLKREEIAPYGRWRGNPASAVTAPPLEIKRVRQIGRRAAGGGRVPCVS